MLNHFSFQEFTSARYIRLVFQRIKTLNADLMTFLTNDPNSIDVSVANRVRFLALHRNHNQITMIWLSSIHIMSFFYSSNIPVYTFFLLQYFYSVKDISVGGQCVCYGHASYCPVDPLTGVSVRFLFVGYLYTKCGFSKLADNECVSSVVL